MRKWSCLQSISGAFKNLANIAGEQTAAGKALAIASTIIDTYMGATKALAAGAGTPVGYINAAAIVATGLANLRTITAVQVPNGGECGCNCINANDAERPKRWNYTRSNVADIAITSRVKFANA
jgi:hypothetical protein